MGIISHGSLFCSTEITSVMSTRVNEWRNNKSNANPAPEKSLPYSMLRTIIGPAGRPVYSANRKQYHVMHVKELNYRLQNIFQFDWVSLSIQQVTAELAGWIYCAQLLKLEKISCCVSWASATAPPHEKFKKFSATYASFFNKAALSKQLFSIPRNYSSATIKEKKQSHVQFSFIRHSKIQSRI